MREQGEITHKKDHRRNRRNPRLPGNHNAGGRRGIHGDGQQNRPHSLRIGGILFIIRLLR